MSLLADDGRKIGMLVFPGSNCDQDCIDAFMQHFSIRVQPIWHTETSLPNLDALIIPGGFSYGDYLRSGHLATLSPVMSDVRRFAKSGGYVLGICNGFQIMTELDLLPGTLLVNKSAKFVCKSTKITTCSSSRLFEQFSYGKKRLNLPVAHKEGRYYIDDDHLAKLYDQGQVLFKYEDNFNGSTDAIAGLSSPNGRMIGMMPHPERAMTDFVGSSDGKLILKSFLASFL